MQPQLTPEDIWTSFDLEPGQSLVWDVGAIRLCASRCKNDWLIFKENSSERSAASIDVHNEPVDITQSHERWAFKNPRPTLHIQPAMPDRPLVVRPLTPLGLPPDSEVQFYINIPTFVQLGFSHSQRKTEITAFPSQTLSNTWFGDNYGGVLCYANKSMIRREKEELGVIANQIICPFKIKNRANEVLQVERICLRVRYLSIWAGKQRLWSNEVTSIFRGHGKETQLEYASAPPKDATEPHLIRKAEVKPERGFLGQTFAHASFPWRKENAS